MGHYKISHVEKKIIRTKYEGFRVEVQLCRNTFVTPAVSETVSGLLDRGWQRRIQICPEIAQKKRRHCSRMLAGVIEKKKCYAKKIC